MSSPSVSSPGLARWVVAGIGVIAVLSLAGWMWLSSLMRGGDASDVAERLPSTTRSVLIGRGALGLAWEFRGLADAADGELDPAALQQLREVSERVLGFDGTDAWAWLDTGLDPARPWAMAQLEGQHPGALDTLVLIPSRDDEALEQWLLDVIERNGLPHEALEADDHTVHYVPSGFARLAFAIDDGYLVAQAGGHMDDVRGALDRYLQSDLDEPLDDAEAFEETLDATDDDWHVLAWASPEALPARLAGADLPFARIVDETGLRALAAALHLEDDAIRGRLLGLSERHSETWAHLSDVDGNDELADALPGTPLAVVRARLNLESAWELGQEDPQTKALLGQAVALTRRFGFDLHDDIVTVLDGHFTSVVLEQSGDDAQPLRLAQYVGTRDTERTQALLDKAQQALHGRFPLTVDRGDDATWYVFGESALSLIEDHLLYVWGDPLGLRRSLEEGVDGFADALPGHVEDSLDGDHICYAYLDLDGVAAAARRNVGLLAMNMGVRPPPVDENLRLGSLTLDLQARDAVLQADTVWRAPGGSFTETWTEAVGDRWQQELKPMLDRMPLAAAGDAGGASEQGALGAQTPPSAPARAENPARETNDTPARTDHVPTQGEGPTFDCTGRLRNVEQMICESSLLSALDREVATAYRSAVLGDPRKRENVRHQQRTFNLLRNRCTDSHCVRSIYLRRLAELEGREPPPEAREPDPPPAAAKAVEPLKPNEADRYEVPFDTNDPQRGGDEALVTIVEFADFQCPFSGRVQATLDGLERRYGKDLRIVWKHNPLPFHKNALPAHNLAVEAYMMGGAPQFWKMHSILFQNQRQLKPDALVQYAQQAGLSEAAARTVVESAPHAKKIEKDQKLARSLGATGTPNFFINGRELRGAQPAAKFQEIIEDELARARQLVASGTARKDVYAALMHEAVEKKPEPQRRRPLPDADRVYDLPVPKNAPTRGKKGAKVVVQLFSEFQCPFCKRVNPTLEKVMEEFGGRVQIVWRNYPLPFHEDADLAAQAAREVFRQGGSPKFWAYHDLLFANQKALKRANLVKYAQQVGGIDIARLETALDDGTHAPAVQADVDAVQKSGARIGTPSFFINGKLLQGAQPYDRFRAAIKQALDT